MYRRYGNRPDWKRITEREYTQCFIDKNEFKGYITLIKMTKVTEPLWIQYEKNRLCIVDDGYMWLQHFPTGKNYSLTTMFNANGDIVQWYIDICNEVGIENNIPWWDDLFLDIIVFPSGEIIQQDAEELEEAFINGWISEGKYKLAWKQADEITADLMEGNFHLLDYSIAHKELLSALLKQGG